MNKYSQLLKKLGLSAAALALSAALAVDSASAADESTTNETETVEQNGEADTPTEEKTEVLSEEKATEATTSEATSNRIPNNTAVIEVISEGGTTSEATQPDRLYGRRSVSSGVNYDHAYFTHKTSKTGNSEVANIRFYTSGDLESENAYNVSSAGKTDAAITYDELRDLVEEKIQEYYNRGFFLEKLDDNPYDKDYSYYFLPIPSDLRDSGYTVEDLERFFGEKPVELTAEELEEVKKSYDGHISSFHQSFGYSAEEGERLFGNQSNAESEKEDKVDKQAEQKPAAGKQAEQKPAAPAKEEQKPEAKPEEQKPAAGKQAEQKTEADKQAEQKPEAGKKDSASKAKANQHDSKWGAFGTEENATRYAVGEFYGNGFKELTNLTQAQRNEIEERLGAAKTMAEFEAIVADAKRMNSGQPQSNQAQSGQAQQQKDGQKQEARGERLPDTATGAWALGAVGLSTILAGLGVKKFKKD